MLTIYVIRFIPEVGIAVPHSGYESRSEAHQVCERMNDNNVNTKISYDVVAMPYHEFK